MSAPLSLRAPLVREKTGWRTGQRYHLVPKVDGASGAHKCALHAVAAAIHRRDFARRMESPAEKRFHRATMRVLALWARIFAGHINQNDTRLEEAREHAANAAQATWGAPL